MLVVFTVFFGLRCVAASCSVGLHDRALVSVVTHFFWSCHVTFPFQRFSVIVFHIGLRVSVFMHAIFAHHCGCAACARTPRNHLILCVFAIPQIYHAIGPCGYFSKLNHKYQAGA